MCTDRREPLRPDPEAPEDAAKTCRPDGAREETARKTACPQARRAKAAAAAAGVVCASEDGEVIAYTDGACSAIRAKPGPGSCWWRARIAGVSRYLGRATNNVAELAAIQLALQSMKDRSGRW